jgi:isopenicillin N synthase-like dioxygenase
MATTTMAGSVSFGPPFPDDVPTAPLLRLSLHKLLKRDDAEVERFNRACEDLGFFYLDLEGDGDSLLRDANQLFDVVEAFCDLPLEEKEKYDFSSKKSYFGYKAQGAAVVDRNGNLDRNEFYNVSHWKVRPVHMADDNRSRKMIYSASQKGGQRPISLTNIGLC